MKKIFSTVLLLGFLLASVIAYAESYNLLDMYQKPNNTGKLIPQVSDQLMLNTYPMVGTDGSKKYYLDTSSCTGYQENDAYIIACLVYTENRNATLTYKFKVRKTDGNFIATLININDSTELAQQQLNNDNGYLRFLFLQAAKYSQYPAAKIQALNTEAETQLKAVEKSRREAAELHPPLAVHQSAQQPHHEDKHRHPGQCQPAFRNLIL